MENYIELQKIIKKGKKVEGNSDLLDSLLKQISINAQEKNYRELNFLTLYYGLQDKALTLENIGLKQDKPLTRERVRQIIDGAMDMLIKPSSLNLHNPYTEAIVKFNEVLGDRNFIRLEEICSNEYFYRFRKNVKGLIAFLNDCNIRQIAYRKNYYFYTDKIERKLVVDEIQKENKTLRRKNTIEKMSKKSKTVTYVPDFVRTHLLEFSKNKNINLNPLYESILKDFMNSAPITSQEFSFSRTKSWKARKGKAQWQQVGIYINKSVFDSVKEQIKVLKKDHKKSVSLMSFICQSFIWHYEKTKS
jgi:hypothetical protein